jgi:hypothetical protein
MINEELTMCKEWIKRDYLSDHGNKFGGKR